MSVQGETLGTAVLILTTDAAGLDRGLSQAKSKTQTAMAQVQRIGSQMQSVGRKLSVAVTAPLIAMGVACVKASAEQDEAVAKLQQAVITAGNEGEIAVANLERHAGEMQKLVQFPDEVQLNAMAVIESLSGVGETALIALTDAAMDMSTILKQDLQTSSEQIARLVNGATDTIRGTGIEIDKSIRDPADRAAAAVEALTGMFGGAAEAAAKVGTGPWTLFQQRLGEIGEKFGEVLIPRLNTFVDKLDGVLTWLENANPQTLNFLTTFATIAAVTGPGLIFLGSIVKSAPAISAAVSGLSTVFSGLGTAIGGLVGAGGGAAMAGLVGGPFGLAIVGFAALSEKAAQLGKDIAYWLMDVATPKLKAFCDNIIQWFANAATAIADAISKIVTAIADWVGDRLTGFADKVKGFAEKVGGFFKGLFDAVVGHSYIPDMVTEIEGWMDRLGKSMVSKSKKAVDDTLAQMARAGNTSFASFLSFGAGAAPSPGQAATPVPGTDAGNVAREQAMMATFQRIGQAALSLGKMFMDLVIASEPFQAFLEKFSAALKPFIEKIAVKIVPPLSKLADIVIRIVSGIMPGLMMALDGLSDFIDATLPFWDVLGKVVAVVGTAIGWLIKKITGLGQVIYYVVTGQFDKIKGIDWGGSLSGALDKALKEYDATTAAQAAGNGTGGGGTGGGGGTTTYEQQRPIYVTVTIPNAQVYGGSLREFALILKEELLQLEELGY